MSEMDEAKGERLERLVKDLLDLDRRRGEKDNALRRRARSWLVSPMIAGTKRAIIADAERALPACVDVDLEESPGKVVVILLEPWWRLLLFLWVFDKRAVMPMIAYQFAAGVLWHVEARLK